jgi:threonine synthase
VQPTGCAPIVRAWEAGAETATEWDGPRTYAAGLRVPKAIGDFLILRALRESGGDAVAVSDRAMATWVAHIGADTGIFACPEGGAAVAAVEVLLNRGAILPTDEVVAFNTGSGLKYAGAKPVEE